MAHSEVSNVTTIKYLDREVTVPPSVYEAAARFFAAYVANDKVSNENEPAMLEKAVGQALELALTTEKIMASSGG
jgi:hypothetical protein